MFRLINNLKNRKGFTLIELIVVLAVLAIIMAIAVPRFLGVQDQAKKDADKSTLGLIAKTAELYYAQGKIKDTDSWVSSSGASISSTLGDAFKADIPNMKLQSGAGTNTWTNINLQIDKSTGKAIASWGGISSND